MHALKSIQAENEQHSAMRVLLVEDSALDAELIVRQLRRHGLTPDIERVSNDPDFRAKLASFRPQIILSDYSMPNFDGKSALVLARELAPDIPFIFVSGTIGEERAIDALKMGATDYVIKTNLARLGPAVESALHQAEQRRARQEAEDGRARLAEILEATTDCVIIWDGEHRIEYLNAGGRKLLGYEVEQARARDASVLYAGEAREKLRQEVLPQTLREGIWRGESTLLTRGGEEIPVSQVVIVHRDRNGAVKFFSTIARDVRERKAYESRISYLAHFDDLTGLPNRTLLQDRALQAMVMAKRRHRNLALVVLDIDRFSIVNQGYDRATGDKLLCAIAARINDTVREGDTVARLAADSYAVLLADLDRENEAMSLAREICEAVKPTARIGDRDVRVTVTAGIALFPRDGEDPDTLLRNADSAMHRAKTEDRGGVQFYAEDMTTEAMNRIEIATALRGAGPRGELKLYYQPQFDLRTGTITGVEALLRWPRPTGGDISPARFIPVAEEYGLIGELGDWVLAEACAEAMTWHLHGLEVPRIGINISVHQLHDDIVDVVMRALDRSGMPPEALELEVTETGIMKDAAEAVEVLHRLKALGVSIAIDDFGTGYSSLSYLSRFPLDRLKIDRAFVHRMATDVHDRQIVQAIVSLARVMNISVLAEGVETQEQRWLLVEDGCNEAQGFLLSPAVPADRLASFLAPGFAL